MIFGCLDILGVGFVVWLMFTYKKSKHEYIVFRKHKEKWLNYDMMYQGGGILSERNTETNNQENPTK